MSAEAEGAGIQPVRAQSRIHPCARSFKKKVVLEPWCWGRASHEWSSCGERGRGPDEPKTASSPVTKVVGRAAAICAALLVPSLHTPLGPCLGPGVEGPSPAGRTRSGSKPWVDGI
jgi:hypothetical protein